MSDKVDKGPRFVEPLKLVERRAHLSGQAPLADMHRLAGSLRDIEGVAAYDLQFAPDDQGRPGITGQISAALTLECQRCLGPMHWPMDCEVRLTILKEDEEFDDTEELSDPLVAGEDPISLSALIEDELILSLPIAPLHPLEQCPAADFVSQAQAAERPNPFAVLSKLKTPKA
jgi:uncharacterized protein